MSLHIESSKEAISQLKRTRIQGVISAWVVTMLTFILLALLFFLTKIYMMDKVEQGVVVIDAPYSPMEEPTPEQMPTSSQSVTPNASLISSISPQVSVVVPQIDIQQIPVRLSSLKINMGDLSVDNFGDIGTEGSGFGGGSPGGSTLEGTFYDTKLSRSGTKPTNLSETEFLNILNSFITHGWNESAFNRFYRSPHKLYISHFYISMSNAEDAPKAFKCDARIKGSRWVAVYKGKVKAPVSGRFRFVGYGDDALVVRFNNENVLDYGWYQIAVKSQTAGYEWQEVMKGAGSKDKTRQLKAAGINEYPMKFYKYTSTPHWNQTIGGLGGGKVFSVEEGVVYPIEVLVSEIPGGSFGMALMIEEVDEKRPMRDAKTRAPILNLFRTNFSDPGQETKKPNAFPFLEDSYVWPVVHD